MFWHFIFKKQNKKKNSEKFALLRKKFFEIFGLEGAEVTRKKLLG